MGHLDCSRRDRYRKNRRDRCRSRCALGGRYRRIWGNQFGVLQLPATSGTGFPAIVDYAAATLPSTPDGFPWSLGGDPHTVTAYVDPNNGKAYGLMAASPPPKWLVVIDLQALLSAPRTPGTHFVSPSYDLLTNGVVAYVSTH
jgi:hypothetical protein